MAKKLDSKAVAEARVELAGIVEELKGVKARAVALEGRLKRAARTGTVVGKINGKPYTVEECFASSIHEGIADLAQPCRFFAGRAREDIHRFARVVVKDWKGELV